MSGPGQPTAYQDPEATQPGIAPADEPRAYGDVIGRYVVLSKLGAGAMGVVHAAYDPQLDRKVALKLLLPYGGDGRSARRRLQREAQSLAKLDHPNVVAVHDVGVHDNRVFVAMEFVRGQTLGAWMKAAEGGRPRPWPEVLERFIAAGQGLAAAHAVDLIHRDFKPENVMVGDDGRVRVMDFGLARTGNTSPHPTVPARESLDLQQRPPGHDMPQETLTRTGAVMGTPAYMAPEQMAGQTANARSDQFAFCISLYEGLYGERPFAGNTLPNVWVAMKSRDFRPVPPGVNVPGWLRAAVIRGLAWDAERRHPSMEDLLRTLADDPSKRRKRWLGTSATAVALAGVAAGIWATQKPAPKEAQPCTALDDELAGVWDDARREQLRGAIEGTKLSYAADTWARVEPRLDAYARQWVDARTEACLATARGTQSETLLDTRMACLDGKRRNLDATVQVLADADETVVAKAVAAVAELPALEPCANTEGLLAAVAPPSDPEVAAKVETLEQRLATIDALRRAGKFEAGLELANQVATEAEAEDYPPIHVRAWLRQGDLQEETADTVAAEATFERAYRLALEHRLIDEAAYASSVLLQLVGKDKSRFADGRRWALDAEPLAAAVGTDEALSFLSNNLGTLAEAEGKFEESQAHYETALTRRERWLGPDHPEVAEVLVKLATVARIREQLDDARAYDERALTIVENAFGPEHPMVGYTLGSLADITQMLGDRETARTQYERSLAILEDALGPNHPNVAVVLNNLATMATTEGDLDQAQKYYVRVLTILEKSQGPDSAMVGGTLGNMATLAMDRGRVRQAERYYKRGLKILEAAVGPEHPHVAFLLIGLGNTSKARQDPDAAQAYYERALDVRRNALGDDAPPVARTLNTLGRLNVDTRDPDAAYDYFAQALALVEGVPGADRWIELESLWGMGQSEVARGNPVAGLPHLERAAVLRVELGDSAMWTTRVNFALARALWDAPAGKGRDRARARELALEAKAKAAEGGRDTANDLASLEAWLAERPE